MHLNVPIRAAAAVLIAAALPLASALLDLSPAGASAVTPTAYVTNQSDNTVTPIATATNSPGTAIAGLNEPEGVAITPDGRTA